MTLEMKPFFNGLQLLALEPDCIEVVESEFDWWKPTSSACDSEVGSPQGSTELCAKTGRSRTFWTHLSSPERKKVYELIGYVEGAPRMDKPKQYIGNIYFCRSKQVII